MLKIVICDDEIIELNNTKSLVDEWIKSNNIEAHIYLYDHPDKLLEEHENKKIHIYILDIVMPMMNGIELGAEIRRLDFGAKIIYTTNAPEYALESFVANPIDYLIKPIEKEKLFNSLNRALNIIKETDDRTFAVKTNEGLRIIPYNMIIFCERIRKKVLFFLTTGEEIVSISIRESFSDYLAILLEDKSFIQPHVSFAINMTKVEKLGKNGFTLRSGKFVPISAKHYTEVRNQYLDFRLQSEIR
ncbi:MAG: LytTR family DNA-binding domain-containing protein [Coprobacillus sp.]